MGGNDTLIAQFTGSPDFVSTTVNIYGDAGGSLSEHAIGGNDVIVGPDAGNGSNSIVNLFGDAGTNLTGYAVGGDDVITGGTTIIGSGATLKIFGDAGENMTDHAIGGNDLIVADFSRHQFLFGDAGNDMSGYAKGGNDQIILGDTTGANDSSPTATRVETCPITLKAGTTYWTDRTVRSPTNMVMLAAICPGTPRVVMTR